MCKLHFTGVAVSKYQIAEVVKCNSFQMQAQMRSKDEHKISQKLPGKMFRKFHFNETGPSSVISKFWRILNPNRLILHRTIFPDFWWNIQSQKIPYLLYITYFQFLRRAKVFQQVFFTSDYLIQLHKLLGADMLTYIQIYKREQ
ncbi:Hypothetical_protein [Hexamita inflata]|uniref:Hypothetical_protein n=1 Tax=Hexamita inflata TaxID=28002 RepID=A0AA86N6P4_9EUKA|nr:Hypothetical protein HINF_LOCUS1114 [Hexamita inflata]